MIIKINPKNVHYSNKIQELCKSPYYGHLRGCPNYGKKKGCPPNQPLINKILDFDKDIFIIYTIFDVGEFAEKIKKRHPCWTNRQCYNPRYWQPKARKIHRKEEERAKEKKSLTEMISSPEAHGANLTAVMSDLGVKLYWEWPPKHEVNNKVYLISLGGHKP